MIRAGMQIFAGTPADEAAIAAAKAYIAKNELTSDDVKLGIIGDTVIIEAKREIKLLF